LESPRLQLSALSGQVASIRGLSFGVSVFRSFAARRPAPAAFASAGFVAAR
jgi:hypothetical protein